MNAPNSFRQQPDARGHFGDYGGRYVAETLMPLILELERAYRRRQAGRPGVRRRSFAGLIEALCRPARARSIIAEAVDRGAAPTSAPAGHRARKDLISSARSCNHTGAHKINNCIGQILLARCG